MFKVTATFSTLPTSGYNAGSFGPSSPYGFNITLGNTYTIYMLDGSTVYLIDDAGQLEQSVLTATSFGLLAGQPCWTIVSIEIPSGVQITASGTQIWP